MYLRRCSYGVVMSFFKIMWFRDFVNAISKTSQGRLESTRSYYVRLAMGWLLAALRFESQKCVGLGFRLRCVASLPSEVLLGRETLQSTQWTFGNPLLSTVCSATV
ncbi:unnamed protein product [Scytosiphon promiscuus]